MPKAIAACLCFLTFGPQVSAQESALARYLNHQKEAVAAERRGNYDQALKNYLLMLEIVPDKPEANYSAARVQAVLGNSGRALELLGKALDLGYLPAGELDKSFDVIKDMPGFSRIQTMIEDLKKPIGQSQVAFTIPEKDLLPEGIAYDPGEDCFFLGSIWKGKILKIDRKGEVREFAREKQNGLRSVAGLRVDPVRRILWAATFVSKPWEKIAPGEVGWTAVFKYDLKTGNLLKKYEPAPSEAGRLFNDLAVVGSGDVFVTDSDGGEVWAIPHETDALELFFRSGEFMYTNGITAGADDRTLYVASPGNGVFRIDIPSKECRLVSHPPNMTLSAVDGLYFYGSSLIGLQPRYNRVCRFPLESNGDSVKSMETIEARNPLFDLPTTGCLAGRTFYYIANSQAYRLNPDGSLALDKLKDVIILRAELK